MTAIAPLYSDRWRVVGALALANIIGSLDMMFSTVALPTIASRLMNYPLSPGMCNWILSLPQRKSSPPADPAYTLFISCRDIQFLTPADPIIPYAK